LAAAAISRASSSVPAKGFSHETLLPAARAAFATGACMKFGVTISTRSICGDRTSRRQLVDALAQPQLSAKTFGLSWGCPKTVCITGLSGGLKNLPTCDQALECVLPMNPCPIRATFI
jgi:hypothetical protein